MYDAAHARIPLPVKWLEIGKAFIQVVVNTHYHPRKLALSSVGNDSDYNVIFFNSHTYVIDPRIGVVQHTFELFPTTTASRRDTWRTPRCRLEFTRSDLAELCLCSVWLPGGEGLLLEGRRRRRTVVGSSRCSASRANCTHHAGRQFHEPHQEPAALAVDQTAEEPDGEPHQQGTLTVCVRALCSTWDSFGLDFAFKKKRDKEC